MPELTEQLPDGVYGSECTSACNTGHHPDCPHVSAQMEHFWDAVVEDEPEC